MKFKKVALGGTFHRIHKGHKALLREAFEAGQEVVIGLTTDRMVRQHRKPHEIHGYAKRKKGLTDFLAGEGLSDRVRIVPLRDPYGPTVWDEEIEAIVVSPETEPTAVRINEIREERGLKPLKILVVKKVLAEDGGPISTTRIISGEIDEEGRLVK
ncbi:MAG: phosphopantetheine adenylyltransferase [Candidatus Geothermarchaeales archaeon]